MSFPQQSSIHAEHAYFIHCIRQRHRRSSFVNNPPPCDSVNWRSWRWQARAPSTEMECSQGPVMKNLQVVVMKVKPLFGQKVEAPSLGSTRASPSPYTHGPRNILKSKVRFTFSPSYAHFEIPHGGGGGGRPTLKGQPTGLLFLRAQRLLGSPGMEAIEGQRSKNFQHFDEPPNIGQQITTNLQPIPVASPETSRKKKVCTSETF